MGSKPAKRWGEQGRREKSGVRAARASAAAGTPAYNLKP